MAAKVYNIGEENSLVNEFLSELRSEEIQKDRMRFRYNLTRLGEIFAYEVSKKLEYNPIEIITPLGTSEMKVLNKQPVLVAILRASLPMHQGMLNYFDRADNAFVSAYRLPTNESFEIRVEYISTPSLQDRTLIIIDPMLATGSSMLLACEELRRSGKPSHIHIVTAISSLVGIEHLNKNMDNFTLWTAAIDDELTAKSYIVPGLGDAGDLAFGEKD